MSGIDDEADEAERLWREHAGELTRYATLLVGAADAPDIVSIAFLKVMRNNTAPRNMRGYLLRAVTNVAHDQRRSRQRRWARDLHAVRAHSTDTEDGDIDIRRAVAQLSVRQRAVVYLTYWEDLTAPQAAEVLGITADSVRRHLSRARDRLRKAVR